MSFHWCEVILSIVGYCINQYGEKKKQSKRRKIKNFEFSKIMYQYSFSERNNSVIINALLRLEYVL